MKLDKRSPRFPKLQKETKKFKGFTLPQRERVRLAHDEKPQHGVSQPMPSTRLNYGEIVGP